MSERRRLYPFNAEQTVNILSEFGPLVTMFVVNAVWGINAGTWALILTTGLAIGVMFYMFHRPPVFPLIASTVTVVFGALTIITGDPKWVQIKVTIFNALFAVFLLAGLALKKNFFKYVFEKTFHYTEQGWNKFTWSFALFFIATAIANEYVRLTFAENQLYTILGKQMNGVNVWILFKIAIVLPITGVYAWLLSRLMHKYRLPAPGEHEPGEPAGQPIIETMPMVGDDGAQIKGDGTHPGVKLGIEFGPLLVFFLANWQLGIYWATGLFMAATFLALIASKVVFGKVAVMPMVTGVIVMVFGGLTLWLQNDQFIKMKPTIVYSLFAAFLLGGLAAGRPLLKVLLGEAFKLTVEGWHKLTLRWGLFFIVLAVLNEVIWRNFSTDVWVGFKVFGAIPLLIGFSLLQVPLIQRYGASETLTDK